MVWRIAAGAVVVGCDTGALVKCSTVQWRADSIRRRSSSTSRSYENCEKQPRGMRVQKFLPSPIAGRCSSPPCVLLRKCSRYHLHFSSSSSSTSSQMLTLRGSCAARGSYSGSSAGTVCNLSGHGSSVGVNASHRHADTQNSRSVRIHSRRPSKIVNCVPRVLGECRNLFVLAAAAGMGNSLKNSQQQHKIKRRGLRVCCAGGEGDGDSKEGGGSVGTTEKEPEKRPDPTNNSISSSTSNGPSANENSSPAPPSGDGEDVPLTALPHAFSFVELIGPEKVDPEDVKVLKESVFGYSTFWVTGQEPFGELGEGVLLLGNLRGKREEVFGKLQRRLKEVMGNKYDLFMVEEPNAEEEDPRGGPRVSFVLQRQEVSDIGPTTLWQYIVAMVLFLLTGGTCLELGISSQLSRLPPEVVQYITNPETTPPPDLQVLVPYVDSALPLAYGVFGVQLFHELGHRLAAAQRNVKLGIPYFIPNITLGSFGSITQFRSICTDRQTKFDISVAGPLAGGLLSLAMFGVGLILSTNPDASSQVVQVPSLLLQGSLLLGLVSRGVLGYTALHSQTVAIHPLVIAGWCGLTTTAFNLLPVGCLDGGRATQAALGKGALNISGLLTYLLLGLGVLGGPLSLPWGLYILIAQRSPEKPCLNDVTDVGSWRKTLWAVTTLLVVATLLPVWDELAEELGIGIISTLQSLD